MPQLEEDRWQGEIQPDPQRQKPRGRRPPAGGLEPDAEPELPGGLPAAAAGPPWGPQGDHGDGAQASPDYLYPPALWRGLHAANRSRLRRASAAAAGETAAAPREGVGLRAEEDRDASVGRPPRTVARRPGG